MKVLQEKCKKCLSCIEICPVAAISEKNGYIEIDNEVCLGCGCCASTCTEEAITYD